MDSKVFAIPGYRLAAHNQTSAANFLFVWGVGGRLQHVVTHYSLGFCEERFGYQAGKLGIPCDAWRRVFLRAQGASRGDANRARLAPPKKGGLHGLESHATATSQRGWARPAAVHPANRHASFDRTGS